jgi:hypothetical protein
VDFGLNARLTPSDYLGVDMNPVRELKRAHEATKVRAKDSADAGTIERGQASLEQDVQALERAGNKLETAGRTVHQVEDLLTDALTGFRANHAEGKHPSANERLLKSADETASDIVGFARFGEEMVFPPSAMPLKFEQKQAANAYAGHKKAFKEQQSLTEHPAVADVLGRTNERLRGEGGVLPTLSQLAETGAADPAGTDESLTDLKDGMGESRAEIEATRAAITAENPHIDVAS